MEPEPPNGRPLRLDPDAPTSDRDRPAFLARPDGAPVYHGFPVQDVELEGFGLGMITDWDSDPASGDAFVVAPDGSRCGLIFDVVEGDATCVEVRAPEEARWGVWAVTFPHPLVSLENAREDLRLLLPLLRPHWERWKNSAPR